ncbi:MAG: DUF222 domain-containing protein [Pseudolysinimonas sp.]|uniref:HNH endonuclease signature motif containing protein n=1 Tax=Pseudolysinimonas sp. TaxID=2680009 RepID=UPI003262EDDE
MHAPVSFSIEVPDLSGVSRVSDLQLFELLEAYAATGRLVDAGKLTLAAEVARRSDRTLGYDGLAQRTGDRTPEALVSRLTGASGSDARQLVTVGVLVDAPDPWLTDVATAARTGDLSVGAASGIATGLGRPSAAVSADDLLDAAKLLVAEAGTLPPEKMLRRARELRDDLDSDGVGEREDALRDKRLLRFTRQSDGTTRMFAILDPESAALVVDAVDCVTAPRRGGPRFVDTEELARSEALMKDPRSTEQIALDALVDMIRIAAAADPGRVFGVRKPSVRVSVDARDLATGTGIAHLEGQPSAISVQTAERIVCTTGYLTVVHHPDGKLDVGRAQRLFTPRQRIALAIIWGGCAVENCDRPPSWTEAHHITPWSHHGATDISNGILLCRHHHLLVHNNGWHITRDNRERGNDWWMLPPPGDTAARPIRLLAKGSIPRASVPPGSIARELAAKR